jgi:hypothetical protein
MPTEIIKEHMTKYGVVHAVSEEKWSNMYRYTVGNGIRTVNIELKTHIPSPLYIKGYRTLISYVGQPTTCYVCNETTHMAQECPKRKKHPQETRSTVSNTWTKIVVTGTQGNKNIDTAPRDETQPNQAQLNSMHGQTHANQATPTTKTTPTTISGPLERENNSSSSRNAVHEMDEHVEDKIDIIDEHTETSDTAPQTHNEGDMQDIPSDMGLIKEPQIQLVEEQRQYTHSSWAEDIPPQHTSGLWCDGTTRIDDGKSKRISVKLSLNEIYGKRRNTYTSFRMMQPPAGPQRCQQVTTKYLAPWDEFEGGGCAVPKSRHSTEIHQPIPYTPYKHELDCSVSSLPPLTFTFVPDHSLPNKLRLST